jgi:hypothetical protein
MRREEILQRLADVQALGCTDFWVYSSGALVLHGVMEECADLDILCCGADWERVKDRGPVVWKDPTWAAVELWGGEVEMSYMPIILCDKELVTINGYPVQTLAALRRWKVHMARPKDLLHVALIDAFLARG